jgi:hypothetical protein
MTTLTYPKFQAPDVNGVNLSGGKVYFYINGTTTAKDTYTDSTLGTPNANPVILNSRGEADIFLDGKYKIVLKTSDDTTIWTVDNYTGYALLADVRYLLAAHLATSGTDTYTATPSPALAAYVTNHIYSVYVANANTSATPTLNLNSLGTKTIKRRNAAALVAGDFKGQHFVKYDGTDMILMNPNHDISVDAGSYFVAIDLDSQLQEVGQHIVSAQKFIPIPLHTLRETTNFDVSNIAANGGILASDTTPIMDAINAATNGCQRLLWASSNNDQVVFQVPLPPDLDASSDLVIHTRIVSGGTTNAVGFTVDSFFNEGDTKVVDTSETNQTTTWAEKITTIAAADVPSGAQTLTVGLTPVAHTTDTLALSAVWIEYTGILLTS